MKAAAAGNGVTNVLVLVVAALLILALGIVIGMSWRRIAHSVGAGGSHDDFGAFGGRDPGIVELPRDDDSDDDGHPAEGYLGHANLTPVAGSKVRGNVTFAITAGSLRIAAVVDGAEPGEHALTIHTATSCAPVASLVASGHLGEGESPHGAPNGRARHLGDLGNLEVGSDGRGELTLYLHPAAYPEERSGGWRAILGKTIALHARRDDGTSQPDGRAGAPVACGVVVRQDGGPHH